MPANFFVDSNIALYILDKGSPKFSKAKALLVDRPCISTQVVAENIHVCVRKLRLSKNFALAHANSLRQACSVKDITNAVLTQSVFIFERYGYTIFDSLIIASAISANCATLYSEDMQHGHVVEGKLTIINPFLTS
ncbi:MAG: PIN domain-containing protein [Cyclobacteriaceae bacterium]|nr:PIN domain-containing protein [Cyclobacteriaceae bacterium]